MVRATHGVHSGMYYWETIILDAGEEDDAHFRIGWSTRLGELQAPVGYDKYSYCYRDVNGETSLLYVFIDFIDDCVCRHRCLCSQFRAQR